MVRHPVPVVPHDVVVRRLDIRAVRRHAVHLSPAATARVPQVRFYVRERLVDLGGKVRADGASGAVPSSCSSGVGHDSVRTGWRG